MKIVIKIISYIFTFILMISLLAGIVLGITTKTVLSQEYIMTKLEETNYYEKIYSSLVAQVEDYIEQSGLENIDIKNVLKKEQVETDINNVLVKIYNGEKTTMNQADVAQELENNLEEELEQKGITLTSTEKKSIDKIMTTVAKSYVSEVAYGTYNTYLEYGAKLMSIINKALFVVGIILYVLPVIVVAIILLFNYNQFRIGLKYLGISALSAGGLMIIANLFIKFSLDLQNLFILNKATSDLVIKIASEFLKNINIAGIINLIIGILFIIIGATYNKKDDEDEDEDESKIEE